MFALSILLLLASTSSDKAVAVKVSAQKSETVCKTIKETGSRLGGKRECRTKEEWVRIEQETQQKAKNNMGR